MGGRWQLNVAVHACPEKLKMKCEISPNVLSMGLSGKFLCSEQRSQSSSVAGCSIGFKSRPLNVNGWDVCQTKKSNFPSNNFFPKMSSVNLDLIILMYVQVFVFRISLVLVTYRF